MTGYRPGSRDAPRATRQRSMFRRSCTIWLLVVMTRVLAE